MPVYAQNPHLKLGEQLGSADVECGIWADILKPSGAEVLATYSSGQHSGKAAITVNTFGKGKAVYIGADLHPPDLSRVLGTFAAPAGVKRPIEVPVGVELTVRKTGSKRWMFVLNHNGEAQTINLPGTFKDALSGESHNGVTETPAYGVLVLTTT
jgi:beta-galactosidase